MATVYEVADDRLGRRLALKRLHAHVADRHGAKGRFLREARAAARVRHPNVVQVLSLGEEGGALYLAMELLEGEDLGALLARVGRLPAPEALDVLLPVIAGVAAAHDAGVIHRDLKPSNIFLSARPGGRSWPKVVDFGVSKLVDGLQAGDLTSSETILGTALYMAPEQARGGRFASFACDQYALAVVLYRCLAGDLPFRADAMYDLLQAIMTAPVSPPSAHAPDVSSALDEVVLRAMQRDAGARFPSVRAFGRALLPFASEHARVTWSAELAESATDSTCLGAAPLCEDDGVEDSTWLTSTMSHPPRPFARRPFVFGATALAASALVGFAIARVPPRRLAVDAAPPSVESAHSVPADSPVAPPVSYTATPTAPARATSVAPPPPRAISPPTASSAAPAVRRGRNDAPILP